MKKFKTKTVALCVTLAMAATSAFGLLSLVGCSDDETFGSDTGTTEVVGTQNEASAYTISSVFGTRTVYSSGTTYYVSPTGSGDGSEESPADLETLVGGDSLVAGDTVILKDGTYELTETLYISVSGTYDMPITIQAETSGEVIISCYGQSWGDRGVQIDGSYINFIGIAVCGAGDNGMYVGGSYNLVENCEFYDNRDTGLQIGRSDSSYSTIDLWPSYNLIKNCTSHNNYDNQTYGENADGFAAKLTLGYGNVFDGCIAYRNSDDGWDLYAYASNGNIGAVYIYNCVAFENGYLEYTQEENNARYGDTFDADTYAEENTNTYTTADGDGNGFKLGGSAMEGDVFMYNCLSFSNRMHGITDNSNPGFISVKYCTAVDNGAGIDDDPTSDTFGQIVATASGEHSNIDLSRQTYSYNHIDHVLSVGTDMGVGLVADNFRGSVQDSYFYDPSGSTGSAVSFYIEGSLDADTDSGITGIETDLVTADVFKEVNITVDEEGNYEYNISGLENGDIHSTYRNEDGSVNMGDLFAVADYSGLFGDENKIGATLNLESYEEYTHYDMADLTQAEDEIQARLLAAQSMLYIQTDENAVYQDFEAVSKIYGCVVSWESDDSSILEVGKTYDGSDLSLAEYVPIIVHRPEEDTEVTLTATIHYFGYTTTKEFTLTVMADNPTIGDVVVIGPDGSELTDGESIIVDKYTVLSEPEIIVYNGSDYSGKALTEEQFEYEITYEYGEDIASFSSGDSIEVAGFTTSQDGAFKVTITATLTAGESAGDSVEFVYYVLVASNTATIDFIDSEYTVTVNAGGFNVSGNLSSAIGTLYAYSSSEAVEGITAAYIMENGDAQTFRATSISFDFANDNTGAYYIYMVFTNGNGEVTSDVYETYIGVVEISTAEEFYNLAQHVTETTSTMVYILTDDIDFSDFNYAVTSSYSATSDGFKGLLNGNGHTISNITIEGGSGIQYVGVFRSLYGGTVTNINFENISVTGSGNILGGIFGTIIYGTVSNVTVTNLTVIGTGSIQRVGGLVGQIYSNNNAVVISNVAIINDTSANADGSYTYQIGGSVVTARVGALAGFAQTSSSEYYMDITITNCYVKALVGGSVSGDYVGGIMGRYDDRNGSGLDTLTISGCYSACVLMGSNRTAGILGGGTTSGSLTVTSCAFVGTVLNSSSEEVTVSASNMSSIIGNYSTADVSNIAAYFADKSYDTTILTEDSIKLAETWEGLGFDMTVWQVDEVNGGLTLG